MAHNAGRLNIFLSYGRDNVTEAEQLKTDLERRGHAVWLDRERLTPGSDWEDGIERGVVWCDKVVLLMTPQSVRRRNLKQPESSDGFCLNEIAKALHYQKRVIPVMLVWVPEGPPTSICRIQYLDMTDCVPFSQNEDRYALRFQRLAEAIEQDALDYGGAHSRLRDVLRPIDFELEISQHIGRFVGRRWLAARIDRWLAQQHDSRVFWLVGEPGVGKSAVAVNLCHERSDAFHMCVSGHEDKGDARRALLSIAYQLSTHLPHYFERLNALEPGDWKTPDALFDNLILAPLTTRGFPPPGRDVLLVIDALDEATVDGENVLAELLARRARQLPAWFRIFVTSRPDFEVMMRMQDLEPVVLDPRAQTNKNDIQTYFTEHLRAFGHVADQPTIEELVRKSGGVFLYAALVVDAIQRHEISLDRLPDLPAGMANWYRSGFRRRFSDLETYSRVLRPVIDAIVAQNAPMPLSVLCGALGVSDRELTRRLDQLGSFFPVRGVTGGRETVAPVHKSLRDWLVERHPMTRSFVAGEYAADPQEGARLLAEHGWQLYRGGTLTASNYQSRFLVQNLIAIGDWARALTLLTDLDQFTRTVDEGRVHEWMRLWRALPPEYDPGEAYRHAFSEFFERCHPDPDAEAKLSGRIGAFLRDMGHTQPAVPFLTRALEIQSQRGLESAERAMAIRELAELHRLEGRLSDALRLYQQAVAMCEKAGEPKGFRVAMLYHDMAECRRSLGRYTDALSYNHLSLSLREALHPPDPTGVANCLNDMGVLLREAGAPDAALEYYERARLLFEQSTSGLESPDLAACLHNIGQQLVTSSDDRDLECLTNALKILSATYVPHHPHTQTCRGTLAQHLEWRARFSEAADLCRAILENARAVQSDDDDAVRDARRLLERTWRRRDAVAMYVTPVGAMLAAALDEDPDVAELIRAPFEHLVLAVHGTLDTGPSADTARRPAGSLRQQLVEACFQLCAFLSDYGYHAPAVPLLRATIEAARTLDANGATTICRALDRLVLSLKALRRYRDAASAGRERIDLLGGRGQAAVAELRRLAMLYFEAGAYDLALATCDDCVALARRSDAGPQFADGVTASVAEMLNRCGVRLKNEKEAFDEAERYYRRALALEPDDSKALGNLALLLTSVKGHHDEAGRLYERSLSLNPDPVHTGNYAFFLHHVRRDTAEAEVQFRRAVALTPPDQNSRTNFALLLVMLNRANEAEPLLRSAWQLAGGRHGRISARILFVKALLESIESRDASLYLGQIKFLMASGISHGPWAIDAFRVWVLEVLPAEMVVLYLALADAISSRDRLTALAAEPRWRSLPWVPLDETWPLRRADPEVM